MSPEGNNPPTPPIGDTPSVERPETIAQPRPDLQSAIEELSQLKENPVVRQFIESGIDREVTKMRAGWLQSKLEEATDLRSVLDIVEASTAMTVYRPDSSTYYSYRIHSSALPSAFRPLVSEGIGKAEELAEAADIPPDQLLDILQARVTWAGDREAAKRYYRQPDDGLSRGQLTIILRDRAGFTSRTSILERQAAMLAAKKSSEDFTYSQQVYLSAFERTATRLAGSFHILQGTNIDNDIELNGAVQHIADLEQETLPVSRAGEWEDQGIKMFLYFLRYCSTDLNISNAQVVRDALIQYRTQSREEVGMFNFIALANNIRKQTGAEPIRERSGMDNMVVQGPMAIDTITDLVLNYGQNGLSESQKTNLTTYAKLASDVFLIGKYLQAKREESTTVGEYLAATNDTNGTDSEYQELSSQFGSVVYWRRHKPGFGVIS